MAENKGATRNVTNTAKLGELVREVRKEQGLTQLDLAGLAGHRP
jgi:DNA-binding XRE family transcriptional regulator